MTTDKTPKRTSKRRIYLLAGVASVAALTTAFSAELTSSQGAVLKGLISSSAPASNLVEGELPSGANSFDDHLPGVARLATPLRKALNEATGDARTDGVQILITSGWRSAGYQERLSRNAIHKYGSTEAAKWVASPSTSAHVSGNAVDIGPRTATDWLAQRGSRYDLCQIYANESWHYELRPGASVNGCPAMYASAAEDPRLKQ